MHAWLEVELGECREVVWTGGLSLKVSRKRQKRGAGQLFGSGAGSHQLAGHGESELALQQETA